MATKISDLNDPEALSLYDELLLLSRKGLCGEQVNFDDCGEPRAAILQLLAMRFKLEYSCNYTTRLVSIRRPATPVTQVMSQLEHHITIICPTGESRTEDADTDALGEKTKSPANSLSKEAPAGSTPGSPQTDDGAPHLTHPIPAASPARPASARSKAIVSTRFAVSPDQNQHLLRQRLLENQVSHPLSRRISSWNIFHSGIASRRPRGRRGPLSAKSRSEIKVLEGVGGACWRCRILRRKVGPVPVPVPSLPCARLLMLNF